MNKRIVSLLKELGCYPVPDYVLTGIEQAVEAGLDGYLRKTVTRQLVGRLLSDGPVPTGEGAGQDGLQRQKPGRKPSATAPAG